VAALSLGLIETAGKYYVPHFSAYFMFAAVIALLLWRPNGLLPAKSMG
jgi:branched-chain amino acid transport system permease protein